MDRGTSSPEASPFKIRMIPDSPTARTNSFQPPLPRGPPAPSCEPPPNPQPFFSTPRPHSSNAGSETASTYPVHNSEDVRRRDRGQRPTATENPDPKQLCRRPSRHCSWARWSRLSPLALRPHPSRHGSETTSTYPVHNSKDVRRNVRRRDRGQRPTDTKDPDPKQLCRSKTAHTHLSTGATTQPHTQTTEAFDRDLRRRNATPNTNSNDGTHIPGSGTAVTCVWPAKIDSPAIVLIAAEFNVSKPPL